MTTFESHERLKQSYSALTSILDTVLGEHAMRPVADTAHNLDRACPVSGNRIFVILVNPAMPFLLVLATNVTPGISLRVTLCPI
jgi:hypothetical protein